MTEPRHCPKCQAELPADAPQGLCPQCLLKAAWDSQSAGAADPPTDPTRLTQSGFVPPTVAELDGFFPQLEILELLGKGGMGAVYKARQPGLDRLVAVKILPPEISHDPAFTERFQREARALARLSHPHIVAVYDFGVARPESSKGVTRAIDSQATPFDDSGRATRDGLCYIVMEFVDGANLRQTIQAGKLTSANALAIVPQICEALQFAHDEGIVHRDIKPENILIDKRGRVKIADFGLAKLLGQDASDHSLTATHQVMGTLRYMAPEQMQGSSEVDHRADIYSLGVVFYELLTGELPMGKFAPPSKKVQVDVRFDEVVLRALEQDPEQRYQHASDVKSEIDSIRTTPAPPKPVNQRALLKPFYEVTPSAISQNPSYARRVGIPSAILLGLFLMVMMMAFSLYGLEVNNHPGHPKVLIIANGAILFWLGVIILHVAFFARRAVPAAFWTTVTLFLEEVRRSIAVAAETRMRVAQENALQSESSLDRGPRFSRFAIAGAVWAIFGLLTVIPVFYFIGLNRVWNGTALPTDIIHEAPPLAFTFFMGTLLAIGAGSPVGTTIYGAIAIGHIKRSGGKIIGLPLAAVDMLFFPLLAVFAGIAVPVSLTLHTLLPLQMIAVAVPSAMIALVACLAIGITVWCKVIPDSALTTITLREKLRLAGIALLIAGIMDAFCALVWIEHNVSVLVELLKQGTPIGWQVASTCVSVGSLWIVYYVVGVALHLMTLEDDDDFTFCLLTAAIAPPGCLIGLPVAVYAMVQLSKPEAKALIPTHPPESVATPPADKHERLPSPLEVGVQTWWLARSNTTRKVLWIVLNCFCAFCILAFLSFKGVTDTNQNTRFQIGFLDPWFVFESNQGPGKRSISGIFLAWSWLFGIGAYGSGWLLLKLTHVREKSSLQ